MKIGDKVEAVIKSAEVMVTKKWVVGKTLLGCNDSVVRREGALVVKYKISGKEMQTKLCQRSVGG